MAATRSEAGVYGMNPTISQRSIRLTDVLYNKRVLSPFIPGDICDRLKFHFGINAVIYGQGDRVVFRSSFDGAPSLTKKARDYLENLLNPKNDQLHRLDFSEEWLQLLKTNTSMLAAIEMEFSIIIYLHERQFYKNKVTNTSVEIVKEMLSQTPVGQHLLSMDQADAFLMDRMSGTLVFRQPVRDVFRQAFAHHAKMMKSYNESCDNLTTVIHDDLELDVVVSSLAKETLTCNLTDQFSSLHRIPSDIFYRTSFLHDQQFFLVALKSNVVSITYPSLSNPSTAAQCYFRNLLNWSPRELRLSPSFWCETFSTNPRFLYKLERFIGVEIINCSGSRSLCIQGDLRETLHKHLFSNKYDRVDNKIVIEVADDLLLSHQLASKEELVHIPNLAKQRLAFFLQGFTEIISKTRISTYWKSVNPQPTTVIDLVSVSSDDEDVIITGISRTSLQSSPEHTNYNGEIEALKKMTESMKKKLLLKAEKALCLGFFVTDIIQTIVDKGAHRAALLSENNFMSLLCEMQISSPQPPNAHVHRQLSELESQFKECFQADYPVTSGSQEMPDAKVAKRMSLLFDLIWEAVRKRESKQPGCASEPSGRESSPEVVEIPMDTKSKNTAPVARSYNETAALNVTRPIPGEIAGVATRVVPEPQSNALMNHYVMDNHAIRYPVPVNSSSLYAGLGRGRSTPQVAVPGAIAQVPTNFQMPTNVNFAPELQRIHQPVRLTSSKPNSGSSLHPPDHPPNFRPIIIDGSNVSFEFAAQRMFNPRGMKAAVDRFLELGCTQIYVLVPRHRMGTDPSGIMLDLQSKGFLSFTPSRKVFDESLGRQVRQTPYDDRLIIQSAIEHDGVIVSNDNFRDLKAQNSAWETFINHRLLLYCFVGERFYVSDDPFGPGRPSLMELLCKDCCDRRHQQFLPRKNRLSNCQYGLKTLQRTRSETISLRNKLLEILPNDMDKIDTLLQHDLTTTDLNALAQKLL